MSLDTMEDERSFINSSTVFELPIEETAMLRKQLRYGFDTVCSILEEIGYYGVRLRKRDELDPFETLVGGLSWCIGYIKPEFNRDIVYTEGMSLGKKIAISEKIIVCLQQMNYPERLWPQQIQGMDYVAMGKVLQWLKVQIMDIRSSIPAFESLAAQQMFEDEFVFDVTDCPTEKHLRTWLPIVQATETVELPSLTPRDSDESSVIFPCDPTTIHTFPIYLNSRCYSQSNSYNDEILTSVDSVATTEFSLADSPITYEETAEDLSQSTDIVQLMRMKQLRIEEILRLRQKEERRVRQLNEYKKQYAALQDHYRQAETAIQSLVVRENNEETAAKLQELKGLLKLLETLTLQYNRDKQGYKEEILSLNKQVQRHQEAVEHECQQYELILNIDRKVSASLASLLSIYRGVNLDILRSRSYLERIPSKPELLFFEGEIAQFMDLIMESSTQLSQCYDVLNNLRDNYASQMDHLTFLRSLSSALRRNRSEVQHVSRLLIEQLEYVIQQLTRILQQYNIELKKRNRLLKATVGKQTVVLEKKRQHSKMMQNFRQECTANKELIKRIRELQNRKSNL
ncbi:hypothetical protein WA171_002096 [Blastocystis sp. BT1]